MTTPSATPPAFGSGLADLLPELRWRGMFHAASEGLEARFRSERPITGYNGFDPSGPWLHIGHLVPIFGLIHLQEHGGRPIVVMGGGTGLIGDPSGRSSERVLQTRDQIEANAAAQRPQFERLLDFSGPRGTVIVNNLDWLAPLHLVDWLRDVGKHFTIPYMLAKDSVQLRLERGLSFTEFSYMLIQATDFEHLHRTMDVELQMGGADQFGNITAGLELIRRSAARDGSSTDDGEPEAFALAYPLLLAPSGSKFGKSEAGDNVWLHPDGTSPYAFYQYWLNTDDRDVPLYLRWFTTMTPAAIVDLEAALARQPEAREAQRALATDLTTRIHGPEAAAAAARASEAAFSGAPLADPAVLSTLHREADGFDFRADDVTGDLSALLVAAGLTASRGEARRLISGGGVTVNETRITDPSAPVPARIGGRWLVVRLGKRRLRVGRQVE